MQEFESRHWQKDSSLLPKRLSKHIYGRRAAKTQLSLLLDNGGTLAVNNHMFRLLYRPSSGCILTWYKVMLQYTQWLLLVTRPRSPQLVKWTQVNPVIYNIYHIKVKVSVPVTGLGVAQRVGRVIALLFHDRSTRRGWVVSSTPRPDFTPGKDPVPILKEARWALGPVWTGAENLAPPGFDPRTDQPVAQSLYRLSYPAHS